MTDHNTLILIGLIGLVMWLNVVAIRVALHEQRKSYERIINVLQRTIHKR